MKVGDAVRLHSNNKVGIVVEKYRRAEPDGNPNGDFMICYRYRVHFGTETMMIQNTSSVEVINAEV